MTEQLADSGLEAMRAAGLEVDVRLGLSPEELLDAVRGAAALVIRSATQVTAEVLEAGDELVVVGRAGIGLDNVDVDAATRRGVMVVNAPQSNVLSAAEHTIALLLAQARNIPQADRDLHDGQWNRTRWEGVELHGKTLGIVGLGRVGVLVAQRANAFGMQLVGLRPVRERRPRPPARRRARADARGARRAAPTSSPSTCRRRPRPSGSISRRAARARQADAADRQHRAAAASSTKPRSPTRCARAASPAPRSTCSPPSPPPSRRCSSSTPSWSRRTSARRRSRRRTRRARPSPSRSCSRSRGEFVPFAVNLAATEASATVQPFMPLAERLGRLFTALAGGVVDTLEISYEGQIADYDCRVLTLVGAQGRARARSSTSRCRS